jgi:hypothetical protein
MINIIDPIAKPLIKAFFFPIAKAFSSFSAYRFISRCCPPNAVTVFIPEKTCSATAPASA